VKSAGTIRHKINQIRYRHLKKRLEAELRQAPSNCQFNVVIPPPLLPTGLKVNGVEGGIPAVEQTPVGFAVCMHGAGDVTSWKPSFCDDQVDGGARARKCTLFCSRKTKEQVKADFAGELGGMSLAEVAYSYPDLAALIWVLDESDVPGTATDSVATDEEPEVAPKPPLPPPPPTEPEAAVQEATVVPAPTVELPAPSVELPLVVQPRPWWARLLGGVWS